MGLGQEGCLADLVQVHLGRAAGVVALEVASRYPLDELEMSSSSSRLLLASPYPHLDAGLVQEAVDLAGLAVEKTTSCIRSMSLLDSSVPVLWTIGPQKLLYLLYVL